MLRFFVAFVLCMSATTSAVAEKPLTVFAASSLSEAMTQIGQAFEAERETEIVFSFAGTGTLARQIEAGAPADVFVSADAEWIEFLIQNAAIRAETVTPIASNELVFVGPSHAANLKLTKEALNQSLGGSRLAIADPDTVPAGRYGKAALQHLMLWDAVRTKLAPMENVRVALAAVARGDAPLGLVYATDATIESGVSVLANIPTDSHPTIEYAAAVTSTSANSEADAFLDFLSSSQARNILRSLGFVVDKEG